MCLELYTTNLETTDTLGSTDNTWATKLDCYLTALLRLKATNSLLLSTNSVLLSRPSLSASVKSGFCCHAT